ncbi:MAG: type IV pilus secretin PilQ [Acidobacteria bacterium]|nr:type IV pilus secretin PilQ [Acidobacteriota bacterium]
MTTSKRTFPLLAMVLIAMVVAVGPAFATRDFANTIPEWITVSAMTVKATTAETAITVKGDFPPNYLTYRPARDRLIVEVRDCDASQLDIPSMAKSPHVLEMATESETDEDGAKLARFLFTLASGVRHTVQQVGNNLVITFTSDANQAPVTNPVSAVTKPVASSTAAAPAVSAASRVPDSRGFIGYREIDAATFAAEAGMSDQVQGRALTGVDTSDADRNRVLLLMDGPASFSTFELANPPRLVVDFKGLTNEVLASRIPMGSSFVKQVRVSQFKEDPDPVVRAVFDLNKAASFDLEPSVAGLNITFRRPDLTGVMGAEIAAVPVTEPVTELVTMASAESAAEETDSLEPSDYAFFSEADKNDSVVRSGIKPAAGLTFESKTLSDRQPTYTGRRISLELVDADLKQVFRLFHEISGLNFILDPSVGGKVTVVLDNVPWDQSLDIILRNNGLDKVFENNVVRIASTAKLAQEAQQRRTLKDAARLEVDPITVSRVLSYAKAEDMDAILRRVLSARGKSFYDQRTNTIVMTDIPEKIDELNNLMDDLDTQTPQVMIEARIVETSREFTRDLGIDWGFLANDQRGAGNSFQAEYDLNLPRVADANRLGLFFGDLGPNGFAIDIALDALEVEGRGRVLSAPKIMAQNNTTAIIEQGSQIPVVNTTATEINVEFISASLKLEVTPQITAEGTIIMDIKVENNSPDFNNRVGTTPAINTQRASTRVLVEDGGTTVIGGVFFLNEGESETGVPGLRKIPGLGWLFKNKNITKENKELLIFITPKIAN